MVRALKFPGPWPRALADAKPWKICLSESGQAIGLAESLKLAAMGFIARLFAISVITLLAGLSISANAAVSDSSINWANAKQYSFTQVIDHDHPEAGTFSQRYWIFSEYASGPGAPVLFYLGQEGSASSSPYSAKYAKELKAYIVIAEHRYYGDSSPVPDFSVENLRYLSVDQALRDFKAIQVDLQNTTLKDSKNWITLGGSYVGMLAAVYRAKWPDLVVGAIVSSAPLLFPDGNTSSDRFVAQVVLRHGSRKCLSEIQAAGKLLSQGAQDPAIEVENESIFSQATPLKSGDFIYATGTFLQDATPDQIAGFCKALDLSTETNPLKKIADALANQGSSSAAAAASSDEFIGSYFDKLSP
jgi:pimeloyl-ACP methyl ester carboxylesterase